MPTSLKRKCEDIANTCDVGKRSREDQELAEPMIHKGDFSGFVFDKSGCIQLKATMPAELAPLPEELIPKALLNLKRNYHETGLHEFSMTKRHNAVGRLRRYRLIPPSKSRVNLKDMAMSDRIAHRRAYLKAWRARH